ncbi:MAG TPA: GNAT family N-acetyltransferase [Pseudobdellovibrionaceae bacterium]|jgi:N-acetylglutamate synthase-like GNAT family acetyltransferase|nr:GNAT family N-acetyltransferase [Pseudobdellovibrionaceae bacterium]
MLSPRTPEISELEGVVTFLNQSLRNDQKWSIASEYPTALNHQNIHNMRIITNEEHRVLSHAVLKPVIVKTPQVIFKVATIGSVVTDEEFRGQGYSSQIIQECLRNAENQHCDVAVLWTNLYDFYRKHGFELAGSEISFEIEDSFTYPSLDLKFSQENKISPEALYRLYSQHAVNTCRTIEDFQKYLKIPNTHVYTAWKTDGTLAAYAIEGKGIDLTGYIHEWSGGTQELLALISYIQKVKTFDQFVMIVPEHAQNLITKLSQLPTTITRGYLGMIKITQFDQLSQKIKKAFRNEGVSDFVLERMNGGYAFGIGQELFTLEKEQDVTQLLFGPIDYSKLDLFQPETISKLQKVLPLKLWLWGWDSI